ncbi:nucleoside phosphorylase [Fusarium coicis]|nr:nucleoside phosphorylase [Fusarium coicis]
MLAPPKRRDDFHVGIVCALAIEYNAVSHVVDEFWDETKLGRSVGDPNTYSIGRIGEVNVVLVLLSGMGKVSAASATASFRASYPNLELVLVTGVCGGVPISPSGEEILLGDVVISKAVVQRDFGRQYPDKLEIKDTVHDHLGRPTKNIRNFVARFETDRAREKLEDKATVHLEELQLRARGQRRAANYHFPGADKDCLFLPSYLHRHHSDCNVCMTGPKVCEASRNASCLELGCDKGQLLVRDRLNQKSKLQRCGREKDAQAPYVFVGHIGSGDTVLKSAEERDRLAKAHGLIAFEMEGAGVWDEIPCIIVKGVCDYADSHKNKGWQNFAAATAAAVSKVLIEEYPITEPSKRDQSDRMECSGPVFHGSVSDSNILTGIHSNGGTQVFNFA